MDFRRSGQLDERRRRVLMDEIASPNADDEKQDSAPAVTASASKGPVRAYGEAVLNERQWRVTDMVLIRPLHLAVAILAGLTAIAGIIAAYTQVVVTAAGAIEPQFAAVDLASRGNLATWFNSLLLAGGAAAAMLVFSIRMHRVDDYRGRYRVWLWTAGALLFASVDAATGLRHSLGAALELLSGSVLEGSGNLAWLSLYFVVFGTLTVRLALETWNSLPAFSTLSGAALLYLLSGMFALELLPRDGGVLGVVAESTLAMLAQLTLVSAIAVYARHVHLDAQGRLLVNVQKEPKKKPKSRAKLSVVKSDSKDDSEHGRSASVRKAKITADKVQEPSGNKPTPSPTANKPAVLAARPQSTVAFQASADDDDDEEGADIDGQNLSKVERKKLKRLARREQQRRAA